MSRRWILVPAAGGGARFAAAQPKQYVDLAGAPLLARTLDRLAFLDAAGVIVALAPNDAHFDAVIGARPGIEPLRCGGITRASTVANALHALAGRAADDDWIVVHDAARPCVPRESLARIVHELADDPVGGLLALPLADTLKRATTGDDLPRVVRTEARDDLWLAQTPQMFRYRLLCDAYAQAGTRACTDDAQAIEMLAATGACGMPRLVAGTPANLKVTYPGDLVLVAAILATQAGA